MKTFSLLVFSLFFHFTVHAKTVVISDIDDTVRSINRYTNLVEQLANAADPYRAFVGMPQILEALSVGGADIYYVSGVIEPLVGLTHNFLNTNSFPQRSNFFHRNWFEDTYSFKVTVIQTLLWHYEPTDTVILIGDNGEHDIQVYQQIQKSFPNSLVYIHKLFKEIDSSAIPASQNKFLTSADLALLLATAGHISSDAAQDIIDQLTEVMNGNDDHLKDLAIPSWADWSTLERQGLESLLF